METKGGEGQSCEVAATFEAYVTNVHNIFDPQNHPHGSSTTAERCEETSEKPKKKKKQKPQKVPQENGTEDPSISFSKPTKKKYFSKEELMSSDLEETAGSTSLLKRKKSSPKAETVNDPEDAGKEVPPRKGKFSKEEPVSSGPEEAAGSKSSSKKTKRFHKEAQEDQNANKHSLGGGAYHSPR
ncbi:PREDICTED: nucleolar protein 56-like [Colobus angolensis palliatus]|uniref:nucleolar protein 56-like n=1 Tax=Colobus angolensis palliatus TaxID=336983 RepID=UPI0005F3760D|nr:PREDICTED: nucleolar protein 56-like [Colobus angolensis palliatus]